MVVPIGPGMGDDMMAPPLPPPPELLRYKIQLFAISMAYIVILLLGIVANALTTALNDIFVVVAALTMALRAERCMGQCVMPFLLFSGMALVFDGFQIITTLSRTYPGPDFFFASSCPRIRDTVALGNLTVYLHNDEAAPDPNGAYTLPAKSHYQLQDDYCNWQWVLANVVATVSIFLDVAATGLAWRMFKAGGGARALAGPGQPSDDFQMMGGGPGGGAGGPGGLPGVPPGGYGGRPGMAGFGGQERQGPSRPQAFMPFSGTGQALNSS